MSSTQAKVLPPKGDTAIRIADALNQHAELLNTGQFQVVTIADLALADATAQAGRSYFVPDESGGPCLVVSDGTNWRVVSLGATAAP